jgi:SPP1 gp7 family putative phage head morphogenesis protein
MLVARTEIVRAHAEGQLTAMEDMGVTDLGVAVEWDTAHDDRVCPKCADLQGIVVKTSEAHGLIPRHPNCRCSWIPANVGEGERGQTRGKGAIDEAITDSVGGEKTTWVGADASIDRDRPESALNVAANSDCGAGVEGDPGFQPGNTCGGSGAGIGITKEEVDAVRWFMNAGFVPMREYKTQGFDLSEESRQKYSSAESRLSAAMNKLPPYSGTAWRGLTFDSGRDAEAFLSKIRMSGKMADSSFASASKGKGIGQKFAKNDPRGVLLEVRLRGGAADVAPLATRWEKHEDEVLVRPGVEFRVVSVKTDDDERSEVVLEEI